jgi:hypothetical protein
MSPLPSTPASEVGHAVRVVMTKWGGRPHWEYDAVLLGRDRHGSWIGVRAGSRMTRPGATYEAPSDQVVLVPDPAAGDSPALGDAGWVATFHAVGGPVRVYVDITTPPEWSGPVVGAVDLDLDVIRGNAGRVWVDDEDEFAEHRVRFGYPEDVVAAALASCGAVQEAVAAGAAPYDGTADRWLAVLAARTAVPR